MSQTVEPVTEEFEGAESPLVRKVTVRGAAWWSTMLRGRKTLLATVGTSFAVFGMWAIQGILLARILGPEGRGEYGTAMFFAQTLIYIGTLGTLHSIARRAGNTPDRLPELGRAALRLGFCTGFLTMVVVAILAFVALPSDRQYLVPLCLVAAFLLPLEHMRLMLLAVDHGSANFTRYNLGQLVAAIALPALLGIVWSIGIASTTLVVVLALASPAFGLIFLLRRRSESAIFGSASPPKRTLVREGTPFAVSVVASNLFNRLDTLLIIWIASLTTQGYYAAALAAVNLLLVAPNALALFSFNWGVKQKDTPNTWILVSRGAMVALIQVVTASAFAVTLPTLMIFVFGETFRGAIPLGMTLLPAAAISGFSQVAEGYLRGRNKAMIGVWARLAGATVLVGTAVFLQSAWGAFAIPIAAAAGNTVCAVWIVCVILAEVRPGQHTRAADSPVQGS